MTRLLVGLLFTIPVFSAGSRFVPVTPCRVVDTRNANGLLSGPRLAANSTRSFNLTASACGLPAGAAAYSVNVTAIPVNTLQFLSIWPTGQTQPVVSTLNSFDGRIVANAAIVPAGTGGSINVFATDDTNVIIDVNGYFDSQSPAGLSFFTTVPCRAADTRNPAGVLGAPFLAGGLARDFPLAASACGLPASAAAYSLNATVVPAGPLSFLTLYPSGQAQPFVSTLNAFDGRTTANAAIVPAGAGGSVGAFATDNTNLILDANGYFATNGTGPALSFFPVRPCRVADTRSGAKISAFNSRTFNVVQSGCNVPAAAKAFALNVTAIPQGGLQFLTIWPAGQPQPLVSTLNSPGGKIVANAAIVPASGDGAVSVIVTDDSDVVLDINGYFAPAELTDFNVAVDPLVRGVAAGETATYTVTVTGVNNFQGQVTLSLASIPAGVQSAVFNPTTIQGSGVSTLTVVSNANGPTGSPVLTVNGTSPGFNTKSQAVTLSILPAVANQASVSIANFAFAPTPVSVAAGGVVTWTNNQAGVAHTVTADGGQFGSGVLATGQTFMTMPTTPGTYHYHCSIHPFMTGTVNVQ